MITIKVIGKVQGVAFRYYTKKKADELGIAGTVQNLDDGSVLIHADSSPHVLDALIKWCHDGSPASDVIEVITQSLKVKKTDSTMDREHSTDKDTLKKEDFKFVILRH